MSITSMPHALSRRRFALIAGAALALPVLDSNASARQEATPAAVENDATPASGTRLVNHALGQTEVPADPQTIIALGDEFLLADLLDLGVRPIVSSASYGDRFIGIPESETQGITPVETFQPDLELIVSQAPDLIMVAESLFTYVDGLMDILTGITPAVVAIQDVGPWRENYRMTAHVVGREDRAEERITELEAALAEAATESPVQGRTVTVATIYPGDPTVALWLTPGISQTEILVELGAELVPDSSDYEVDQIGRTRISIEQIGAMTGEILIMLQTSDSPEEQESLVATTDDPLWQTIPAVAAGEVHILERVGFPGSVRGRFALIDTINALPVGPA